MLYCIYVILLIHYIISYENICIISYIGLVLFVLNIASLFAFFTITSAQESSDEYISKVLSQRTLILTLQHKF